MLSGYRKHNTHQRQRLVKGEDEVGEDVAVAHEAAEAGHNPIPMSRKS